SRRRHTRFSRDWSSDVCSSDLCFLVPPVNRSRSPPPDADSHTNRTDCAASESGWHIPPLWSLAIGLRRTIPHHYSDTVSAFRREIGRASCREIVQNMELVVPLE